MTRGKITSDRPDPNQGRPIGPGKGWSLRTQRRLAAKLEKARRQTGISTLATADEAARALDAMIAAATDPETTGEFDSIDFAEGGDGKVY